MTPPTTTLDVWLRADAGFTPALWSDQSGNGNNYTQATGGNQASLAANALGFLPAVSFNGTSAFMTSAYSVGGAKTIAWIRKIAVAPTGSTFLCPWTLHGPSSIQSAIYYDGSGTIYKPVTWKHDVAVSGAGLGVSVTLDTNWHAEINTYSGGTNTSVGSYTELLDNTAQTVITDSVYNPRTGLTVSSVGCDLGSGGAIGSFFGGLFLDFLVYHSVLGASDMAQLNAYMSSRMALPPPPSKVSAGDGLIGGRDGGRRLAS